MAKQPSSGPASRQTPARNAQSASSFEVAPVIAFYIFAAANLLAALYAPIQDCDEVYNYWEPTHYLMHGYGRQTWEYSPEYTLRSWLYISLHAIVGTVGRIFLSKTGQFYFIRICLGLFCAFCQMRLFTTIARVLNPRVAIMFLLVTLSSPGMFHASASFLPSSFSMCFNMLGTAAFLDWKAGPKTHLAIMWFGIGGVIGWPFAAALAIPFFIEEIFLASITGDGVELVRRTMDGILRSMIVLGVQVAVDLFFYHRIRVTPMENVLYNVFVRPGRGPSAFGTEPADFYLRNLLVNFHVWFVLALAAAPILIIQHVINARSASRFTFLRGLVFTSSVYLWLGLFSLQPHKEERFIYPIYPCIALNAALALHAILAVVGNADPSTILGKTPARLRLLVILTGLLIAVQLGLSRVFGTITAYRAPLRIYEPLKDAKSTDTVCLGKEWHRFPSSFFLPRGIHVKFVKSEFEGLLPGEFSEARVGFGFFPGTWLVPAGMNDENIPDVGKLLDIQHCTYLVDSYFPGRNASAEEPDYVLDAQTWEPVKCEPFLDARRTGLAGRLLWLPKTTAIPAAFDRYWGEYCLLRRKDST